MHPVEQPAERPGDRARNAVRALAHPSGRASDPDEVHRLLGNLREMSAALAQTCQQLAAWHTRNAPQAATGDGSRPAGHSLAEVTAMHLTRTAGLLARATDALDEARNANSMLAWPPIRDQDVALSLDASPSGSGASRLGEPRPLRGAGLDHRLDHGLDHGPQRDLS